MNCSSMKRPIWLPCQGAFQVAAHDGASEEFTEALNRPELHARQYGALQVHQR